MIELKSPGAPTVPPPKHMIIIGIQTIILCK